MIKALKTLRNRIETDINLQMKILIGLVIVLGISVALMVII